MVSEAKNVTDYLEEVPEKRKKALLQIRKLCKEILKGYEEGMSYKLPSYKRNGLPEVSFASQKNHICIYFTVHDVMLSNKELLKELNHGKGCIRYSNPDKIDFEIIKKLLIATFESTSKPC
jgi:uncharacterized protein YdhG (YjbR/CyaY superfamily)